MGPPQAGRGGKVPVKSISIFFDAGCATKILLIDLPKFPNSVSFNFLSMQVCGEMKNLENDRR